MTDQVGEDALDAQHRDWLRSLRDEGETTDILGAPWVARWIPVTPAEAAPGADHAVLVYDSSLVGSQHAQGHAPSIRGCVLYVHGRNDYFFHTHVAQALAEHGWACVAVDVRACGRAGLGYVRPHDVRDLRVHDEETLAALRIIREEFQLDTIVMMGHSTGGLQTVIFAHDHPSELSGVVLNSPWLNLKGSALVRSYGSAFIDLLARRRPEYILSNKPADDADAATPSSESPDTHSPDQTLVRSYIVGDIAQQSSTPPPSSSDSHGESFYGQSLHRRWGGEWDYDLLIKPSPSVPVRAGFIAGVRRLQREARRGLAIPLPILVCAAQRTGDDTAGVEEARSSDVVLVVEDIVSRAPALGEDVEIVQIEGGTHDLALAPLPARQVYIDTVLAWLDTHITLP